MTPQAVDELDDLVYVAMAEHMERESAAIAQANAQLRR
jgi:hypothetical protein